MGKFNFDEEITRRGTSCIKWDYQGGDYIPMWVADMDFRTPDAILKAVSERLEHGVFGYASYQIELEDLIPYYYKKYYDITIDPEWVVWVPSVMPGANIACRLAGGKMMYNTPMYSHIRKLPVETGYPVQEIPLKCKGGKYTFDFERMDAELDKDVRAFILCNPHNPVGRVYTKEELLEVSRFCEKHELLLISDEIHSQLLFQGSHIPAFTINDFTRENSVTLTSAGKTYNMPAIPVGFAIIPNRELRNKYLDLTVGIFPVANVLSAAALKAAYTKCDDWHDELIAYLKKNRDYLEERIGRMDGLEITHNEATYLSLIDTRSLGLEDPWNYFRQKAGINFSDGRDFAAPGFVRANFGCTRRTLEIALNKVEKAVEGLK